MAIDPIVREFADSNATMVISPDELLQLLTDLGAELTDPAAKAAIDAEIANVTAIQEADPPVFMPRGVLESGIAYRLGLQAEALALAPPPVATADIDRLYLAARRLRIAVDPELPIRVDEIKQLIAEAGGLPEPEEPPLPDVPPVTLTPIQMVHPNAGNTGTFQVTVDGPGVSNTWTVEKQAEATWITVDSPTAPQTASGPVNYTVAAGDGTPRTGYLYVNGKTFTVIQDESLFVAGSPAAATATYSTPARKKMFQKNS